MTLPKERIIVDVVKGQNDPCLFDFRLQEEMSNITSLKLVSYAFYNLAVPASPEDPYFLLRFGKSAKLNVETHLHEESAQAFPIWIPNPDAGGFVSVQLSNDETKEFIKSTTYGNSMQRFDVEVTRPPVARVIGTGVAPTTGNPRFTRMTLLFEVTRASDLGTMLSFGKASQLCGNPELGPDADFDEAARALKLLRMKDQLGLK